MRLVKLACVTTLVVGASFGAACGGATQSAPPTPDAAVADTGEIEIELARPNIFAKVPSACSLLPI